MGRILAAADIGSNTVHVLIAEVDSNLTSLTRLDNRSEWVSLGETVAREGRVPEDTAALLVNHLQAFKRLAKSKGADRMYVFGTEAMRAATNHDAIMNEVLRATSLNVDLISPHREAELGLRGALLDRQVNVDLLFEIGGGSGQIARANGIHLVDSVSLPIGTGRLIVEADLKSPCLESQLITAERNVRDRLESLSQAFDSRPKTAIATGGVIRGLWRALHPDGEKCLHRQEIAYMTWATAHLSITRIAQRFNVKNKRAATLLPGALVYGELMDWFELTDLHVSEYGVREGAILELAKGSIQGCLV